MVRCGEDERRAAEAIIHSLDHRGYLVVALEEIARTAKADLEVAEEALELVQSLGPDRVRSARPVGMPAWCRRGTGRILSAGSQLRALILREHLTNLERRNYAAIAGRSSSRSKTSSSTTR